MSTPPGLFPCEMASKGMSPSKTTVLRTRNKEEKKPLEGSLLGKWWWFCAGAGMGFGREPDITGTVAVVWC